MSKKSKNAKKITTNVSESKTDLAKVPVETALVPSPELAKESGNVEKAHVDFFATVMIALAAAIRALVKPDMADKTPLEVKPYVIIFGVLRALNAYVDAWGAKSNAKRDDFPHVGIGKAWVSDTKLYRDASNLHVDVDGGYVHYVNNVFHFFRLPDQGVYMSKKAEVEVLAHVKGMTPEATTPEATTPEAKA